MNSFFSLVILLTLVHPSYGQVEVLNVKKGLSNRDVTCILQTKNGYMWFGTLNGLNRYDGYSIKEFNYRPGEKNNLSNGKINCLFEDATEKLWIGTENGVNILDQRTGKIKHILLANQKTKNTSINSITSNNNGEILAGTGTGEIFRFRNDNKHEQIFQFSSTGYIHDPKILFIEPDKNGALWIMINHDVVYKLSADGIIDTAISLNWGEEIIAMHIPVKLGNIGFIIDQYRGIRKFNTVNGNIIADSVLELINKKMNYPTTLFITQQGDLWIGTNTGKLARVNLVSGAMVDYSYLVKPYVTGALRELFVDKTGVVWVGTNFEIVKFFPGKELFENYLFVSPSENIANKNSMRGIIEDDKGDIYAGGYSGLFRLNKKTNKFERFKLIDYRGKENLYYSPFRLLNDTNGFLWITSEGYGLYRFNKKTGKFEFPVHASDENRKAIRTIYSIVWDENNKLLLGSSNGLFQYDITKNKLEKRNGPSDIYDISNLEIMDIEKDTNGELWIGSYNTGVFKWKAGQGVMKHFSTTTIPALTNNAVTDIALDSSGNLWIGTRGGGLNKLDKEENKIKSYSENDGLADDIVAGIIPYRDNIWISTFNGLSKLNTTNEVFENYFEKDGITDNEFNITSHVKTKDGKIYMGGLNGLNAFYPAKLARKPGEGPLLFLTKVVKHDGNTGNIIEVQGDSMSFGKLDLSYQDKFFAFHFALADYYNQAGNKFSYMLEGFDNTWINLGTQNNVRFNNIPAGDYVLKVKAYNSEGVASANILVVPVHIISAIYTRTWFIITMFMLAAGIVYLIIKYRVRQQLKLQKLRTKISSDLHDEVGSLLTRVSIQAELIKQGIYGAEDKKEELEKIAHTSRLATSAMNDVLWSIDARNDKMSNLIDHMKEHINEVLGVMEIESEFVLNEINTDKEIEGVIRQNLFLIFKEAIHNIAKHSDAKKISVKLENKGGDFLMIISDDGKGLKEKGAMYQKGQGLRNMEMRAKNINATIQTVNDNGYTIIIKRNSFC